MLPFGPSRHWRRLPQPLSPESGPQHDVDETTFVERPTPNQLFHAIKVQLFSEIVSRKIVSRCRKSIDTRDASCRYRGQ